MTSRWTSFLIVMFIALPAMAVEWDNSFNLPGVDGQVNAIVETDQGLVVAGKFASVAGVKAYNVAMYHAGSWQSLDEGLGFGTTIYDLAVDDQGHLFACGTIQIGSEYSLVARLGESGWEDLGLDFDDWRRASVLAWDEDGLWIGGNFREVNGMAATGLALWNDGAVRVPVTLVNEDFAPFISDLLPTSSGMVVAGSFDGTSEFNASGLLRYQDGTWEGVNTDPIDGSITTLTEYFGFLMVGGYFTQIGGVSQQGFAIYTGSSWTTPCITADTYVSAMAVSGSEIWVVGDSEHPLCHWNGASWEVLPVQGGYPVVRALLTMDNGEVAIGGSFIGLGDTPAASLAHASASGVMSYAMPGLNKGLQASGVSSSPQYVTHLLANNGQVVMEANVNGADGKALGRVPLWQDGNWSALSSESIVDAVTMNDQYIVIADINGVSRMDRDTGTWAQLGGQNEISGVITDLMFWGDRLMATGYFTLTDENGTENALVWWDDNESRWRGTGTGEISVQITSMVDAEDRLYVAGAFTVIGNVFAAGLASWDGESWSGAIRDGEANASAMLWKEGELYVASTGFTASDGGRLDRMSPGGQWTQLLSLDQGSIRCMVDDGEGGIYLGGNFQDLSGSGANNLAHWSPEGVSPIGNADGEVMTMDLDGRTLYLGGSFRMLEDVPSYGFGICTLEDRSPVRNVAIRYTQQGLQLSWDRGADTRWRVYHMNSPYAEDGVLLAEVIQPLWNTPREVLRQTGWFRVTAIR